MARSISNAKLVSSFLVDQFPITSSRGYTATAAAALQGGGVSETVKGSGVAMMKKEGEESIKSIPWVPDPVTGYYKPEGYGDQVDPAELREMIFKQKTRRN